MPTLTFRNSKANIWAARKHLDLFLSRGQYLKKPGIMKGSDIILAASAFILFAGCATTPDNASDIAVRAGMSRSELKVVYGEPLRIESSPSGAQDWYYNFYSWAKGPTVTATTTETDPGGTTVSSSSESWQLGKDTVEEPIHLSPEGYVVEPLPSGKVLKH